MEWEVWIKDDEIITLYHDDFDFADHGDIHVERATNVEFFASGDGAIMGWHVQTPAGDPWSCSVCFGSDTKRLNPCGCCFDPMYCRVCKGLGFEVFESRDEALEHERVTLFKFLDRMSFNCEFDPFDLEERHNEPLS